MPAPTEICNFALLHLGVSTTIENLDTEKTKAASVCRRVYPIARDEVFRDFNWPFAKKIAEAGLVEENPNEDWAYSYRYPSDCARMQKILSGIRNDSRSSRIAYEVGSDDSGRLIFTNQPTAILKYNKLVTDSGLYTADFVSMLSLLIASYIAPSMTAGDPYKLGERAFNRYYVSKTKAEATAANEEQDEEMPDAESIRSRE